MGILNLVEKQSYSTRELAARTNDVSPLYAYGKIAGPSPVWDKHCAQWRRLQKIGRKLYVVDLGVQAGQHTRRQPKCLDGRRLFPGNVCPKSCGGRDCKMRAANEKRIITRRENTSHATAQLHGENITEPTEQSKREPKLWALN